MRFKLPLRLSFYNKQFLLSLATHLISLVFLSVVVFQLFLREYYTELNDTLRAQSNLLSSAISSAIIFENKNSVDQLLEAALNESEIKLVQVYFDDGLLFSEARSDPGFPLLGSEVIPYDSTYQANESIYYKTRIHFDGELIGFITIGARMERVEVHKKRLYYALAWVFLLTSVCVFIFTFRAQLVMEKPIKEVVNLVNYVKNNDKYNKRVNLHREDDIGDLIDGVNQMLDTIQRQRDEARKHAEELESLVALRTEQLFNRAHYDSLTRLTNRQSMAEFLDNAIDAAKRSEETLAVLFLDLDRFKVINDTLGHAIGDRLLMLVARKLLSVMRKTDCVSRWGGDEFVIVIRHVQALAQIEIVCKKIIDAIEQATSIDEHQIHISTSIGVAIYPQHGDSRSDLLKNADASMYAAKNKGPSHYCIFEQAMLDSAKEKMAIEAKVRKAIQNQDFDIVYQPQVCSSTGEVYGLEALARWHTDGTFISPGKFIPAIEETGLMVKFTQWIIREVCAKVRSLKLDNIARGPVAINVPASVLSMPDFPEMLFDISSDAGIEASRLEIEITESTFVGSSSQVMENLLTLREQDIEVAVDDFGKGYSCLSYLSDLPITKLKVDGSFVKGIEDDPVSRGIIEAMVLMAKTLNLTLTAECVETEAQLHFLREIGVNYIQGYLFSEPLAFDAMKDRLKADKRHLFTDGLFDKSDIAEG